VRRALGNGSRPLLALTLCLVCTGAFAAARPRYGGTLKVAVAGAKPEADPLLADAPEQAAMLALTTLGLCRLDARGVLHPLLAQDFTRPLPNRVRVSLKPMPGTESAPNAQEVTRGWMRLFAPGAPSPYRALLAPLRGEARQLSASAAAPLTLDFALAYAWPDFEKALCHPALSLYRPKAPGVGPYTLAPGNVLTANLSSPAGRPYPDKLMLASTTERGAARLLTTRGAQVVLGTGEDPGNPAPPALFATYLAFSAQRVGADFRQRFEAAVDRADLVRFFVRAPALPMYQLLPPALMPQMALARPAPLSPLAVAKELTLVFDTSLDDARAVAERIQVKLYERGYKVTLKPLTRAELRARWASGDFDLMLHPLLLPPLPAPALAVVMEAAGRHDLLPVELPLLGAVSDQATRDTRARERAEALKLSLSFIPLYTQSLRVQTSPTTNLPLDAQGLPMLEDAFLVENTP